MCTLQSKQRGRQNTVAAVCSWLPGDLWSFHPGDSTNAKITERCQVQSWGLLAADLFLALPLLAFINLRIPELKLWNFISVNVMQFSSFSYCSIFKNLLQICYKYDTKMRSGTDSLSLEYTDMDPCDKVCIRERQNKYCWEQHWIGTHFKLKKVAKKLSWN